MRTLRRRATGPHTIRGYLKPAHGCALPFDHARVQGSHAPLDQGFAELMADERLAVRFIIEPANPATARDFRAQAKRLWAERHAPPDTLGGRIRHLASSLWWGLRQRTSLSRVRLDAPAVEEKARARLLSLQIHCRVQAATRDLAESRMGWLRQGFDACASWRNWLQTHKPWRWRRFDRCFAEERSWAGATFLVSHEEAYALTGLPLLALATLNERQVWTRWSGGDGKAPHATGPQSDEGRDA